MSLWDLAGDGSPLPIRVLVAMRPWTPVQVLATGKRDVQPVKRAEQFLGFPELLEDVDHGGLRARFPCHFLVG